MHTLVETPDLLATEREGLLTFVMRHSPDDAAFDTCGALVTEALTRQERLSTLIIIPAFDGPVRASRERQRAFVDLLRGVADRHLGTAVVVGVPGLKGTMVRLTVNTVLMLARLKRPVQLHASLPDAVSWLQRLPGQLINIRGDVQLLGELSALR